MLSDEQAIVACKNIGYDLTCGLCAMRFYTGYTGPTDRHDMILDDHDSLCQTDDAAESMRGERDAARKHTEQALDANAKLREALRLLRPYFGTLQEPDPKLHLGHDTYENARKAFGLL